MSPQPWRHPLKLLAGDAHPSLAGRIAAELGLALESVEVDTFADGETHVSIGDDVREAIVAIVQPTSPPVNHNLVTLGLLADAARAAGAARVVGVVSYFGYARQDERREPGVPRSAQVVARFLQAVQLDHLITLDLHSPALESALPMPATLLRPDRLFVPVIREWNTERLTVVAPDAGGMKRAQRFAAGLNADLAAVAKTRPSRDVAVPVQLLGDVRGRTCVIIDDMASTGRTLVSAAEALRGAGARAIHAVFTHAVMAGDALERICAAGLETIVTSDSVPGSPDARLRVVTIAPLVAEAIRSLAGIDARGQGAAVQASPTER